ncbi:MAG TPA: hypothetical protein VMD91_16375 [Candidatus Sulfotelmatobacter sp.]|nr:hypothetical protein [Candidatus Sulfotelmatobacter sp.]
MRILVTFALGAALACAGTLAAAAQPAPGPSPTMEMDNRYGGDAYYGAPDLEATAAFVKAGGGPNAFDVRVALRAIAGDKLYDAEVAKLSKQYGSDAVVTWVTVWNFLIPEALQRATAAGVALPPTTLSGTALAARLVHDGDNDGTFWTGYMLDRLVTHGIHDADMDAIEAKYGKQTDELYHKMTNQAMFDLAGALGAHVALADEH